MTAADKIQVTAILRLAAAVVLPAASFPASTSEADRTVYVTGFDLDRLFDANNSPEPYAVIAQEFTIPGGGTYSLDLTDAPTISDANADLTGKRLIAWSLQTPTTNAAAVIAKPAGASGYNLAGDADGQVTLPAGSTAGLYVPSLATIASGARYIDFTGTAADVVRVVAIFDTPA